MATLHFKGKSAVWNHHLSVPYRTLDPVAKMSHKGKDEEENLIIEGDNLVALKALLPKYQGKIKCIYIDPPYNTGNEGWVYSDNVSNPIIKSWIGETVGKEGEDLTRHDKWLCMMTPRMRLLRELLDDDGVIFVSVDDNEMHYIRFLMDAIFGESNYIGNFQWKKKSTSTNVEGAQVSSLTDYTFCYTKTEQGKIKPRVKYAETREHNKSDDIGNYRTTVIEKKNSGAYRRDSMTFEILGQRPREGKRWQIGEETARVLESENRLIIENGIVKKKIYSFEEKDTTSAQPLLLVLEDVGSTDTGGKSLEDLFGVQELFDNPKPVELVQHLISIVCEKDDLILDSFAGSGTTAQAVLELNKDDGGDRKFILVQIPEETGKDSAAHKAGYKTVQEITQARAKKVIERDDLDTGFTYYKLGQQIDAEGILTGELPNYDDFAKYVYYLATGKNYPTKSKVDPKKYFVGKDDSTAVFLVYENDFEKLKSMALTLDLAKDLHKQHEGRKIVYAPACFLDEHHLDQFNITFVGIPFNLFERN